MKKILVVITVLVTLATTGCKGPSKMHNMTSTPIADTPGSGAKMIDSAGKGRPDSLLK